MSEISVGIVAVAFNSGAEIVDCVETALAAAAAVGLRLRVVVVDNASQDDTVARLRDWAAGHSPYQPPEGLPFALAPVAKPLDLAEGGPDLAADAQASVTLIHSGGNRGYAGGVNVGLAYLARFADIGHFWVLNPDSVVPPEAMAALRDQLATGAPYGLMGGRVTYFDPADMIQMDGATVNRRTGVTVNRNLGASHATTPAPASEDLDFFMGSCVIASRRFYETVGPMHEDYFLYYEETDWALRRGNMALVYCPGLRIYHLAGTSIGSPTTTRLASPFSLYFKHRARLIFVRRLLPKSRPTAYAYTLAYAARCLLRDLQPRAAEAVLRGAFGLAPPKAVRDRLGPATCKDIFGT